MANKIYSKTKLPNDDLAWYKYGIYPVKGAQTASTNAWTGSIDIPQLYDGLTIAYYLPYAGTNTAATLNLTLADGTTTTGAINVYYTAASRITTHYGAGSVIVLTYYSKGSISVAGKATTEARWLRCDFDSNSLAYQVRLNNGTYVAKTALYRYQVLLSYSETTLLPINAVDNSTATTKTLTTEEFDPFGPILYYSSTTAVNANAAIPTSALYQQVNLDLRYSFNTGASLTNNKDIYIVASPQSNGRAKLHTTPISQTLPTTDDGLIYIYLGHASSTQNVEIHVAHPIYWFKDGKIRLYTGAGTASTKDIAASGNASTTQVVMGNDTRLSDTRTPKSHTHGNIQNGGTLQTTDITIASGDKLVVTDSSDSSKVARASISFDGSTATKCLTQKGTWESFTNNAGTVTGSSLTANNIILGNGNSAIKSSGKTIATSITAVDTTIPTSNAVKTYVDGLVANATHFKGSFNASNGKIDGGSNTLTSVEEKVGDMYVCDTNGTYCNVSYEVGDSIIFKADIAAGTAPVEANIISVEKTVSVTAGTDALAFGATKTLATVEGVEIKATLPANPVPSNNVTGSGTSGYLTKWNGTNTITNGPQLGSGTTTYLRNDGSWATPTNTDRYVNSAAFADDTTANASNPVKMTLTRAGSDTATVTANIPKVSSNSAGVVPKGATVSTQSQTTKFLREDGSWAAPSYTTNTDAKTSSSNSTSKLFLVGATAQSTSGQTTYSNSGLYTQNGSMYLAPAATATGKMTFVSSKLDRDGTVSATVGGNSSVLFTDKDLENVGSIDTYQWTDGKITLGLTTFNETTDGVQKSAHIYMNVAKNGTVSYDVTDPEAFRKAIKANGASDISSKIYLMGSSTQQGYPESYTDDEVYVTSGVLTTKSVQVGGGAATLQYNSTTESIDFIFA